MVSACRFTPNGWNAGGLSGRRRPMAWWRLARRSSVTCSKALTGAIRCPAGVHTRLGVRQVDSPIARDPHNGRRLWLNRFVPIATDILPDGIETLQAALAVERQARQEAEARATGAEAMVAHLKLVIAKLRRERFGPSAERGSQLLDQLELQLEELEASATEDELAGKAKSAEDGTVVTSFTRRKPVRTPLPEHLL